ncbi:MAG: RNHCP domain-containing protein [Candidatus Komeilibacteria bacterium]|nr:RNHCP domain-containing protein [Candidatus Komeilibacteria bacterium]
MSLKFKRTKEDFDCENCQSHVKGDGYTNHCPSCLYSKHVDNNPGDRAAVCGGLMKPVGLDLEKEVYKIRHCCVRCGVIRRNKAVPGDDFNKLIELSKLKK